MGYRIDYQGPKKVRGAERRTAPAAAVAAGILLLGMLAVNGFWPRGREVLRAMILPGEASVTAQALDDLVDNLLSGDGIGNALDCFCRQVMDETPDMP